MQQLAKKVKEASLRLSSFSLENKNNALKEISKALWEYKEEIIKANLEDLKRSEALNLAAPLLKRLKFDEAKIKDCIEGIESLISLDDPVGKTLLATQLDEGLELYKVTCPIGVIGVIFESRPDALIQISTLCLKSGNAVLLKGGSEAQETNRILAKVILEGAKKAGLDFSWLALLETREDVKGMLKLDQYINLIIPRGSNEFVRYVMDNSSIPVLGHADGICHCFVDREADLKTAVKVVLDSKTQYVAVCNALETLLVDQEIASKFLPKLKSALDEKKVTLIGCPKTCAIISANLASEEDWSTEYLDYTLSVKVVSDLQEAMNHINTYGSGHTDSIITENQEKAARFMDYVDSGNVFWNCSTRFSDGFRYGFGAEVGISTNKIHARGPVGLDGLVIYKFKLLGKGQTVAPYANGEKKFTHKKLPKDFNL